MNRCRSRLPRILIVHNHLVGKLSAEIVETEVGVRRGPERHIVSYVPAECPGILESMAVVSPYIFLACRKHPDIVHQRHRIPQSPAAVGPDDDFVNRGILESQPWRELESAPVVPVSPDSGNCREFVFVMEGIFTKDAGIQQISHRRQRRSGRPSVQHPQEILIEPVVGGTQACSEFVRFIYFILVQHVEKSGMLSGKILRSTEI